MVGLTRYLRVSGATPTKIFGRADDRTSWTIYNADSSPIYWSNTRLRSSIAGFKVPANTAFTLKIPEDDPRPEVWIYVGSNNDIYIYEGYGGMK